MMMHNSLFYFIMDIEKLVKSIQEIQILNPLDVLICSSENDDLIDKHGNAFYIYNISICDIYIWAIYICKTYFHIACVKGKRPLGYIFAASIS